jgi:predicted ArsR family transcriptional regulator
VPRRNALEMTVATDGDEPGAADSTKAAELDANLFAGYVSAVTSAFGDPTRREIYLFARGPSEGVTAADVAARFHLHPNVARHHLDKLAAGGYLDVALTRPETAGRPSKRYRAVAPLQPLDFTPRRDDLVATLLVRTIERLDPAEASALAEDVGFEYGQSLAARMAPIEGQRSSVKAAMAAVADALTAHGFAAHTGTLAGALTIVAEACPFGISAQRFPHVMCAIDRGMVRGMLSGLYGETQPEQAETRPSGAAHCVTRV